MLEGLVLDTTTQKSALCLPRRQWCLPASTCHGLTQFSTLQLFLSVVRLQLLEGNRYLINALGSGLWPVMVLLSEIVQTFILADFW